MESIAEKTTGGAQFTPGPWYAVMDRTHRPHSDWTADYSGPASIATSARIYSGLTGNEVVGLAVDTGPSDERVKANARLIAAAPTLLAAAKAARMLLGYQSGSNPEYEKVWRQVTDAIALAEGPMRPKASGPCASTEAERARFDSENVPEQFEGD